MRSAPPIERSHTVNVGGEREIQRRKPAEYPFRVVREGWTSITEIYHLTVGALAVMLVGLSMMGSGFSWIFRIIQNPISTFSSALIFMFIFVSHELAHKVSAKYFGLWAEFRLNLAGITLTILSILFPLIKIIMPGAMMISGTADKRIMGKIAFAGPLTNLILASFLFAAAFQHPVDLLPIILLRGAMLSAWIAVFNMIPISMLDGAKVLWWSKSVWTAGFGISVALFLIIVLLS